MRVFVEGNLIKVVVYTLTPHTLGSIRVGETVVRVRDETGFVTSDPVLVEGADWLGGDLETTIASLSGNAVTVAEAAGETMSHKVFGKRVNPSTAQFKVKRPNATIDTYTHPTAAISNPVAGKFVLTYAPPAGAQRHGLYLVRFISTGTAESASEISFRLTPSGID